MTNISKPPASKSHKFSKTSLTLAMKISKKKIKKAAQKRDIPNEYPRDDPNPCGEKKKVKVSSCHYSIINYTFINIFYIISYLLLPKLGANQDHISTVVILTNFILYAKKETKKLKVGKSSVLTYSVVALNFIKLQNFIQFISRRFFLPQLFLDISFSI